MVLKIAENELIVPECTFFHIQALVIEKKRDTF